MNNNRKLTTGFYRPTESFKSIPEHVAVMFKDNCGLVAVVGASDDTPQNVAESVRYAKLFAAAPDLLEALTHLAVASGEADALQHAGLKVPAKVWSEINAANLQARAAIAKATGDSQ